MNSAVIGLVLFALGAAEPPPDPADDDVLGDVVVGAVATDTAHLPPRTRIWLAAEPGPAARWVDAVAWGLDLFGTYRTYVTEPTELATRETGVRLSLSAYSATDPSQVRVLLEQPGQPDRVQLVRAAVDDPKAAHRITDATLELLTGTPGVLSAPLAFVRRQGKRRQAVLVTLADPTFAVVSKPDELVATIAFAHDLTLVYTASVDGGAFKLVPRGVLPVGRGSVYGVAVAGSAAYALAQAIGGDIRIVLGPSRGGASPPISTAPMALQPALSPGGRLAYVAAVRRRRRVFVSGRAVSSPNADAQSPTFCPHPAGLKLAWIEHRGGRDTIVVANGEGRDASPLGTSRPALTGIACSPDGRLLAVLSRDRGRGSLLVGNVDRWDPQRVAQADGDTVRWAPGVKPWAGSAQP